ncbi:hypothetical protein DICSQDRAFT_11701, partial [Dichomitus squalens LYAD-421 SS1]
TARRPVDPSFADEMPQAPVRPFMAISRHELAEAVASTSSRSAPGPDHMRWPW